ncbi:hypothetical protein [Aquamicrobium sp.]|uniref:hypothetical protein n=1 Tax=Aquamicrobium sp. TaxID=1872579 RepID=UPI00258841B5|nr:hypothetical protein [Aquamicrobium sp.]MCK9551303.1 hypothetical protein [Aquamicrobium sp.]
MSRFDWDTYNATKDSPAGAVHATKIDWTEYLPEDDSTDVNHPVSATWHAVVGLVFVAGILAFFAFVSTII